MNAGLKNAWDWCRRYLSITLFICLAFIAYVLFFNENSVMKSMEYSRQITDLKHKIKDANDTLQYYNRLNSSLDTDPETMERIVRERYHMQRPNEDVYLID